MDVRSVCSVYAIILLIQTPCAATIMLWISPSSQRSGWMLCVGSFEYLDHHAFFELCVTIYTFSCRSAQDDGVGCPLSHSKSHGTKVPPAICLHRPPSLCACVAGHPTRTCFLRACAGSSSRVLLTLLICWTPDYFQCVHELRCERRRRCSRPVEFASRHRVAVHAPSERSVLLLRVILLAV
jgi:hypothetical protein